MHPVFRTGLVGLLLALGPAPVLGQTTSIAGDWLGTSICVDRQHFPACKDEQVVYEARVIHTSPDAVVVRAYKVVNRQREFMGEYSVTLQEDGAWASEVRTDRFHLLLKLQVAGDPCPGLLLVGDFLHHPRLLSHPRDRCGHYATYGPHIPRSGIVDEHVLRAESRHRLAELPPDVGAGDIGARVGAATPS